MIIFVVPAYNEEENISALLEGMREKTGAIGRSFHVLVIDDGSRDRTGEIVRSYSTKLSLEVIRQCNLRKGASKMVSLGTILEYLRLIGRETLRSKAGDGRVRAAFEALGPRNSPCEWA